MNSGVVRKKKVFHFSFWGYELCVRARNFLLFFVEASGYLQRISCVFTIFEFPAKFLQGGERRCVGKFLSLQSRVKLNFFGLEVPVLGQKVRIFGENQFSEFIFLGGYQVIGKFTQIL
ncbi:MAG: hypothetical protein GY820_37345, partial [Gammaproteobacteria bacterium]|nr:hypothetical protein [Gammaproteobacteria bacterium]